MKRTILFLLVWYFVKGNDYFTFADKAACERLNKHYKTTGYVVSDCDSSPWSPFGKIEQHTSGNNSPAIVGGKGNVTIRNGEVKK